MAAGHDALGHFAPGNLFGSGWLGYAVGNQEFLESSESKVGKYFRSIEYGTHGFEGRMLSGLWGEGTRLRPAGDLVPFGPPAGQQFFPFGASTGDPRLSSPAAAMHHLREGGFADEGRPAMRGRVTHEIAPMGAYEKGAQQFDVVTREMRAIEQAFRDSGLGTVVAAGGRKPRGRNNAYGAPGRRFQARLTGRGFIQAQALSTRSRSLATVERVFQANLTEANRLLAHALASEVALAVTESLKRPLTSKGWLEEATLAAENRFPN